MTLRGRCRCRFRDARVEPFSAMRNVSTTQKLFFLKFYIPASVTHEGNPKQGSTEDETHL